MEQLFQFIVDYGDKLLQLVVYIVGIILFIVSFRRTGSVKKALQSIKEYEDVVTYLTEKDKAKQAAKQPYSQSFTETVKDYILDPVSNELKVSPIPKNVQDYISSFKDVALQRALERFLPTDVKDSDEVADYTQHKQDLSVIADAIDLAEDYRQQYNLDPKMSVAQIYAFVDEQAKDLQNKLLKIQTDKETLKNVESSQKETE